jgi:hypothetical protein
MTPLDQLNDTPGVMVWSGCAGHVEIVLSTDRVDLLPLVSEALNGFKRLPKLHHHLSQGRVRRFTFTATEGRVTFKADDTYVHDPRRTRKVRELLHGGQKTGVLSLYGERHDPQRMVALYTRHRNTHLAEFQRLSERVTELVHADASALVAVSLRMMRLARLFPFLLPRSEPTP